MKFCTYCGMKLENGAVCNCRQTGAPTPTAPPPSAYNQASPPNQQYAPGMRSSRNKMVMMVMFLLIAFGLPYFYAGLPKKGLLMLCLWWPSMLLGIVFLPILWWMLIINICLFVMIIKDFVRLANNMMLDGKGLVIM